MIAATAGTLETGIVIEIVFHVVAIIEVVANNVSVLFHDEVATVGIVAAFPFLGWSHVEIELTDTHQRHSEKLRKCRKGADGEVVLTA